MGERKEAKQLSKSGRTTEQFGLTVQEITADMAKHFGLSEKTGVIVTDVKNGSPADEAGLKVEDIILKVNNVAISSLSDYLKETAKGGPRDVVLFLVKRGDASLFVTLRKSADK